MALKFMFAVLKLRYSFCWHFNECLYNIINVLIFADNFHGKFPFLHIFDGTYVSKPDIIINNTFFHSDTFSRNIDCHENSKHWDTTNN